MVYNAEFAPFVAIPLVVRVIQPLNWIHEFEWGSTASFEEGVIMRIKNWSKQLPFNEFMWFYTFSLKNKISYADFEKMTKSTTSLHGPRLI